MMWYIQHMSILLAKTDPFIWIWQAFLFSWQLRVVRTPYYFAALAAISAVIWRVLWSRSEQTSSLYQYYKLGNTAYYELCEWRMAYIYLYKDNKIDLRPRPTYCYTEHRHTHQRVDIERLMRRQHTANLYYPSSD
jgi:hypothetical protein